MLRLFCQQIDCVIEDWLDRFKTFVPSLDEPVRLTTKVQERMPLAPREIMVIGVFFKVRSEFDRFWETPLRFGNPTI